VPNQQNTLGDGSCEYIIGGGANGFPQLITTQNGLTFPADVQILDGSGNPTGNDLWNNPEPNGIGVGAFEGANGIPISLNEAAFTGGEWACKDFADGDAIGPDSCKTIDSPSSACKESSQHFCGGQRTQETWQFRIVVEPSGAITEDAIIFAANDYRIFSNEDSWDADVITFTAVPAPGNGADIPLILISTTADSINGPSTADVSQSTASWTLDTETGIVTGYGSYIAQYQISPFTTLFAHDVLDLSIGGFAPASAIEFTCIEGSLGAMVGGTLCGNYNWGSDLINDSSLDYFGTEVERIIGGDDVAFGPPQSLAYYDFMQTQIMGSTVIVTNAIPNDSGYTFTFECVDFNCEPIFLDVNDYTNQPRANAEANIVADGLSVGGSTTANSDLVPAGYVISQNPTPCSNCAVEGDPVSLVISLGPAYIDVNDYIGQPQAVAEANIAADGLTVGGVTTENSNTVPAGSVISQNPSACGACALQGDPVDLVISSGPAPVPEQIDELIDAVEALDLPKGLTNALTKKLKKASKKLTDGNPRNDRAAVNKLNAFINQVSAQSGKKISEADADALIAAAQGIIDQI